MVPGRVVGPQSRVSAPRRARRRGSGEAVVVDGAPVMCPAEFAEALTAARRAAADADAAAENARDAVTCQICYVQRRRARDALLPPAVLLPLRDARVAAAEAGTLGQTPVLPRALLVWVLRCKLTERVSRRSVRSSTLLETRVCQKTAWGERTC